MRYSKSFIPTLRQAPGDADIVSAKLMMRAGLIRKLSSGIYEWLPLGLKVLKKVEKIVRQEMNSIDGQEVWLPLILPKELWEETGRWNIYGKELFRLKDRKDSFFCLGPTHEEVMTDLVRREVRSYKELPLMLYQFGTKFRDEIRPRFGVIRAREFYMKDAYSFHRDEADADKYYRVVYDAYKKIFDRCGFKYRAVEAATGAIGGSSSHEFMVLADTGEGEIAWCSCGYGANTEIAECKSFKKYDDSSPLEKLEVNTPGAKTVEEVSTFLKEPPHKFVKTLIYIADSKPLVVLVRGDYEVNEFKIQKELNISELILADEKNIENITGAPLGFAGPVGLKEKVRIIADKSIEGIINAVSGANKKDYHIKNINDGRDFKAEKYIDIRKVVNSDKCPKCGMTLKFSRGIEVGQVFKLGIKYSKSMGAKYLDENGKENIMVMGTYGIGVSRIVASLIEQCNDESGIIWPVSLAPFEVLIVPVNYEDGLTKKTSEEIYKNLKDFGIDVIIDDRIDRAGVKFKDADLIGIPFRITVSEKTLKDSKVEFKSRWQKREEASLVDIDNIVSFIKDKVLEAKKV